ncbi:hypothetical protein TrRE_jg6880, partial [Triparma retinervis]
LQFVPALVLTIKNLLEAREATISRKVGQDKGDGEEAEDGIELGEVESPIEKASSSQRRTFTNAVSTREDRSLSKQAVGLGGDVVSKHEKRKG